MVNTLYMLNNVCITFSKDKHSFQYIEDIDHTFQKLNSYQIISKIWYNIFYQVHQEDIYVTCIILRKMMSNSIKEMILFNNFFLCEDLNNFYQHNLFKIFLYIL